MKISCFIPLILVSFAWGQDIVLKAEFQVPAGIHLEQMRFPMPIDINDDGVRDIPTGSQPLMFMDPVTMTTIYTPQNNSGYSYYGNCYNCPVSIRRNGLAEYVFSYTIRDYITNTILVNIEGDRYYVLDYDNDGLDDIIVVSQNNTTCWVYGVATGNPAISPPQDLTILQEGQDNMISWSSVTNATAYRIEWSSALDGVGFTRIGTTTGTTFIHKNQAGQERGFYRVLSEDNGTGVVRVLGTGR